MNAPTSTRRRFTLRKKEILRGRKAFQEIFTRGRRINGTFLQGILLVEQHEAPDKQQHVLVGFSARSTVKRAVDRNRIKRLMRESYRLNKHIFLSTVENSTTSIRLLFLFAPKKISHSSELPSHKEVEQDVKQILDTVANMNLK